MTNIGYGIKTTCEECGKEGYDFPCLQFPDGSYKVLCDECCDNL